MTISTPLLDTIKSPADLRRLSENQRATLLLYEIEGRCGAEIAQIVGVPVNTVWLWLHRARKQLSARAAHAAKLRAH